MAASWGTWLDVAVFSFSRVSSLVSKYGYSWTRGRQVKSEVLEVEAEQVRKRRRATYIVTRRESKGD